MRKGRTAVNDRCSEHAHLVFASLESVGQDKQTEADFGKLVGYLAQCCDGKVSQSHEPQSVEHNAVSIPNDSQAMGSHPSIGALWCSSEEAACTPDESGGSRDVGHGAAIIRSLHSHEVIEAGDDALCAASAV